MNIWLNLSEGLFLFGPGAITRVEPIDKRHLTSYSKEHDFNSVLYSNNTKITVVKNTIDEINQMLDNKGETNEN